MPKFTLTVKNNTNNRQHCIIGDTFAEVVDQLNKNKLDIFESIKNVKPYTVQIKYCDGYLIGTYFDDLDGIFISHEHVDYLHNAVFDNDIVAIDIPRDTIGRCYYVNPADTEILYKKDVPYKLKLRDKFVSADTYDVGAIAYYCGKTVAVIAVHSTIEDETIYDLCMVNDGIIFKNALADNLTPDPYNQAFMWEVNND